MNINSNGSAITLSQGVATISASSGPIISNNATLTVTAPEVTSLFLTPSSSLVFIPLGQTLQFTANAFMTDGSFIDVTNTVAWSSTNTTAATVSSTGLVSTVTQGFSTSIRATATTSSGSVIRSTTVVVDTPALVSFAISPVSVSIPLGLTQAFTAQGTFSDGSVQDVTNNVIWQSTNTGVATIGFSNGIAASVNQGSTTIFASSGGITSTNNALLTVTAPDLVSINVLPTTISLSAGSTQQFIATGIFTNGSSQIITNTVNWNSSNPAVASISAGGLVTANTAGSTSITASQNGITSSGSAVSVTVASLVDIQISPNGPQSIEVGETLALAATGIFSNGSSSDITSSVSWISSNTAVATVDTNGNLTGLSVGSANITASSGGVSSSNSVSLSVTAPVVTSFSISSVSATVAAGDSIQFTATATLSNGGTSDITNQVIWSSNDSAIATFNSTPGLLTGVANGTVSVGGSHIGIPSDNTLSINVTTRPLQVRINEIMAGLNGDSNIQFIELVTEDVIDKLWGPQGTETTGRLMLTFFDRNGNQAGRFVVPADPDANTGSANTVLFSTQEFATLAGITPDFVIPKQVMPISGKICVKANEDNPNAAPLNLCLSYGGTEFNGNPEAPDAVNPASLPIMNSVSLRRSNFGTNGQFGNGNQFNGDFVAGIPTPASTQAFGSDSALTRNLDQEVTMPAAASLAEQGDILFSQETFQGNGRTCASCHVPTEAFGMPPSHVATVPNDDPLFVNEFNVNTLVVLGASQPSDFRIGDVVTGSLGGSAKIIAGTGDTYFMYGGLGLNVSGNVITDSLGNSATLLTVVQGDLDTLEDSNVLRGPRALVTENINGFDQPAFLRSSPTLLNIKHAAPFGLSGEFATLQDFTSGAVQQHFPLSLNRVDGVDFRIPTAEELDAMTVFQESILTVADENFDEQNNFDRFVTTEAQKRGRELFFGEAKCSVCHNGPVLATSDGTLGTALGVNENFNTGVMLQQINIDDGLPPEQIIGQPDNSREFNTPPLMGIRDTAPFFHESSAATLLEAVQFYDSLAFRASPAATQVGTIDAVADPQNAADIVAFLEALIDAPVDLTRNLDFAQVDIGVSSSLIATITNTSQANITISNAIINGADASEFTVDNAAISGTIVTPGNSVVVNVTFSPTLGGTKSATMELVVIQSGKVFNVGTALSGSSTAQLVSLQIQPASVTLELGDTANFTATGSFNDGSQSDVSSSVTWSSSNVAVVSISNSGVATAVAEGTATINAVSGAVNATTQANVTVVNGNITVSPNPFQFPDHDINNPVSPSRSVTITNNGAGVLAISAIAVFGSNAAEFTILNDSGETSLAPSASRTLDVEFNPSAAGTRIAGIRILSDDADEAQLDIPIEAIGLNPQVSVVPMTTLSLGTVAIDAGSSSPVAAVITNTGESNLTISSVSIAGTNAAEFTIAADTAETVLTQNMSRTVNIAFDPAATGQRTANLQIATDDFDNPTVSISLTGEGVASNVVVPSIQVTPNTVDYPDAQDINNKTAILKTVAITNTGNGDLAINSIELTGPNRDAFVITTDSGESVLAPMEARTIVLNFSPNVTGNLSATLTITSNDPDSPTIQVPITGEAVQQDGGTGGGNNGGGDSGGGAMHIELLALLSFLLLSRARIRRREKQF